VAIHNYSYESLTIIRKQGVSYCENSPNIIKKSFTAFRKFVLKMFVRSFANVSPIYLAVMFALARLMVAMQPPIEVTSKGKAIKNDFHRKPSLGSIYYLRIQNCAYFFHSFCGCWVIIKFAIFHKIKVLKCILDQCCHLVAETGSWFILMMSTIVGRKFEIARDVKIGLINRTCKLAFIKGKTCKMAKIL